MIWFVDLEFSNLNPIDADIIEMAIIIEDNEGNRLHEFVKKYAPCNYKYWDIEAEKIHGYTYKDLLKFDSQSQISKDLNNLFCMYECNTFVCHSLTFSFYDNKRKQTSWAWIDYYMLEWSYRKYNNVYKFFNYVQPFKRISTINLAKENGHKITRLNVLADLYDLDLKHHEAISDCLATRNLYWIFQNKKLNVKKLKNGQMSQKKTMNCGGQRKTINHHQEKLLL